jgi:hypothetical protein
MHYLFHSRRRYIIATPVVVGSLPAPTPYPNGDVVRKLKGG